MIPLVALVALAVPVADPGPAQPSYYWRWSDGGTATERTLREPAEGLPPVIVVTATPPASGRLVLLQFRSSRGWVTEDSTRTDRQGQARLALNPYCESGSWCARDFAYRLRVDGRTAQLTVRFAPSGPDGTATS